MTFSPTTEVVGYVLFSVSLLPPISEIYFDWQLMEPKSRINDFVMLQNSTTDDTPA